MPRRPHFALPRATAVLVIAVLAIASGCEAAPPPPVAPPGSGDRNAVGCPSGANHAICERSATAARSDAAARAIKFALHQVGKPYRTVGRFGPEGYDCSGLMWQAYASAGVDIGANVSGSIISPGGQRQSIPVGQARPGDMVWRPGHIVMVLADGKIVEAAKPGTNVRVVSSAHRGFTRAVAIIPK